VIITFQGSDVRQECLDFLGVLIPKANHLVLDLKTDCDPKMVQHIFSSLRMRSFPIFSCSFLGEYWDDSEVFCHLHQNLVFDKSITIFKLQFMIRFQKVEVLSALHDLLFCCDFVDSVSLTTVLNNAPKSIFRAMKFIKYLNLGEGVLVEDFSAFRELCNSLYSLIISPNVNELELVIEAVSNSEALEDFKLCKVPAVPRSMWEKCVTMLSKSKLREFSINYEESLSLNELQIETLECLEGCISYDEGRSSLLKNNPNLKFVSMQGDCKNIGYRHQILDCLEFNRTLQLLSLGSVKLPDNYLIQLLEVLRGNEVLSSLQFACDLDSPTQLETLISFFEGNVGFVEFLDLMMSRDCQENHLLSFFQSLTNNNHLISLKIGVNSLSQECIALIGRSKKLVSVKTLHPKSSEAAANVLQANRQAFQMSARLSLLDKIKIADLTQRIESGILKEIFEMSGNI
jgi:hypothetical protein